MANSPYTQTIGSYPEIDTPASSDVLLLQRGFTPGQYFRLSLQKLEEFVGSTGGGSGDMVKATYDPANIAQQLVGLSATQTLTNKVISGTNNTLTVRLASDVTGNLPVANLGSGTGASSTTYWRGDGTWATPSAGGATWGSIGGSLSSQTDLNNALTAIIASIPTLVSQLTNDSSFITASALTPYAPTASPTFTGTVTLPAGTAVNGVTLTTGGSTSNFLRADGTYAAPPGGGGGITAPGTTTSTALVRWNSTTGAAVSDSGILVDASNNVTGVGTFASGNQTITGTQVIASSSAAALSVGQNGATNPALLVDCSTASSVTGLSVKSSVAGNGITLAPISSFANEPMTISTKGTANLSLNGSNFVLLRLLSVTRLSISATQYLFSGLTASSSINPKFSYVSPADSGITASTEATNVFFDLGVIRQHATGALTLQREYRISSSTQSFVAASTITDAAAFAVDGATKAGTNATITNSSAIYSAGVAVGSGVTNSYGLNISANTGATNNYVGRFGAGVIQRATTTVGALIAAATAGAGAQSMVSDALTPVFGAAVTGGGAVVVPVYSDGTNWIVG